MYFNRLEFFRLRIRYGSFFLIFFFISGCDMSFPLVEKLPRDVDLPLFNPHMAEFRCENEAGKVPPLDAQAQEWFLEARALESPEIFYEDRDYKKIVSLTRQAASRQHWKAMLNLASLYLEGHEPGKGEDAALEIVESAMRLGVPAAYDRMGTYYMNGTGVSNDSTKAYAFWQKAAQMGSPQAMTYLAEKMVAVEDKPDEGMWANIAVARTMLECALGQGYGQAADQLSYEYLWHPDRRATDSDKQRALRVLHMGVGFGCEMCANKLWHEFHNPDSLVEMFVPFVDKARAQRYAVLGDALAFNPDLRFPNLDQVVPLPPATVPSWNGDKDTLIKAAMGVSHLPASTADSPPDSKVASHHVGDGLRLRQSGVQSTARNAPFAGYWQLDQEVTRATQPSHVDNSPKLYSSGEPFDTPYRLAGSEVASQNLWRHWLTVEEDRVRPKAAAGLTRIVARFEPILHCTADATCPVSGVWQPWVDPQNPMHGTVNQCWRQGWIVEGQPFPDPQRDWLLDVPANLITWHLMDPEGVDLGREIDI